MVTDWASEIVLSCGLDLRGGGRVVGRGAGSIASVIGAGGVRNSAAGGGKERRGTGGRLERFLGFLGLGDMTVTVAVGGDLGIKSISIGDGSGDGGGGVNTVRGGVLV